MARIARLGWIACALLLGGCQAGIGYGSRSDDVPPAGPVAPTNPTPSSCFPPPDAPVVAPSAALAPETATPAAPPAPLPPTPAQVTAATPGACMPSGPCCSQPPVCCEPPGQPYIGIGGHMFPGWGGQALVGLTVASSSSLEWAVELGYSYDDLTEWFTGEGQTGKVHAYTLGLLARTDPCGCRHWSFRGGIAAFNVTGRPQEIEFDFVDLPEPGVYYGGYLGIGYEWDLSPNWSTGPEARILGGWSDDTFGWTPMLMWNLYIRL